MAIEATENTKKTTPRKRAAKTTTATPTARETALKSVRANTSIFSKSDEVEVKSNVAGELTYTSPVTKETFAWNDHTETNWMTIEDLIGMRNHYRRFFSENWIDICGDARESVLDFLKVSQHYKGAILIDEVGELFELSAEKIVEKLSPMSESVKRMVANYACDAIDNGTLTNINKIRALEDVLACDLIEK